MVVASPTPPIAVPETSGGADRLPRGTGRRHRGAIVYRLGTAILAGGYRPGDTLPSEVTGAGMMNVARSAYREAIQVLIAKGLVESRPKTGTRVLDRQRWNLLDPDVLAWAFAGTPDLQLVRDLFEMRAVIEPGAARLAAERRDRDDVRRMRDALAAMRRHTLATEQGRLADREFHTALLRATRNGALMVLSAGIGAAVNLTTQFKHRAIGLPRDAIPDHVRVFDAIAAADGAAAEAAMGALVRLALDDTRAMTHLGVAPPSP